MIIISLILFTLTNLHITLSLTLEYRIQNGYLAKPGEFPMIVLLLGETHLCTGTIISRDKIITAGHCACGDSTYKVYANITNLNGRYSHFVQYREALHAAYPIAYQKQCNDLNAGLTDTQEQLGGSPDISIFTIDKPFNLINGYIEIGELEYDKPISSGESVDVFVVGYGEDSTKKATGQLRFGIIKLSDCPKILKFQLIELFALI
ncbi:unnamed protein product [Heterobilharzia americana]|nr:unnamed protein product [Heterobilharzia americana]